MPQFVDDSPRCIRCRRLGTSDGRPSTHHVVHCSMRAPHVASRVPDRRALEHMERLRRVRDRNCAIAAAPGQAPAVDFDPRRPWDSVWIAVVEDQCFWHEHVEEQALIILPKLKRLAGVCGRELVFEKEDIKF